MSPRQARRERREAERKAKKADLRRERAHPAEEAAFSWPAEPSRPVAPPPTDNPSPRTIANRANARLSTGPVSEAGKAAVSQNNFRHGLRGAFKVLPTESQNDYNALLENFIAEHKPANPVEAALVEKMTQHFWLSQRAVLLQETCFDPDGYLSESQPPQLALYLRYQATHERAFHKCSDELRKLRNEKRKIELGFERHRRAQADIERKNAAEKRKQDRHQWDMRLAQVAYEHQELKNLHLETPECRIPNRVQRILTADRAAASTHA
ncbi:MAG: hypothetical protein JO340_07850 [Acidobacteriaceae bacterium]|nr:hypothetical protein [Acidobacteriaceae bacterium]